jgi:hypothetical protein
MAANDGMTMTMSDFKCPVPLSRVISRDQPQAQSRIGEETEAPSLETQLEGSPSPLASRATVKSPSGSPPRSKIGCGRRLLWRVLPIRGTPSVRDHGHGDGERRSARDARGDASQAIQSRAGHEDFATTQGYIREAESIRTGFGDVFPPLPLALLKLGSSRSQTSNRARSSDQVPGPLVPGSQQSVIIQELRGGRDSNPRPPA